MTTSLPETDALPLAGMLNLSGATPGRALNTG
jgi:hypothetical protein